MTFDNNKKLTVINLFAGPGTGKSTTAAGLFAAMKMKQYNVELVHEIAKDYVWESHPNVWTEQDLLFALQHRQVRRLVHHNIDYAITDSPILQVLNYMPEWYPKSFEQFVVDVHSTYNNINIFLQRISVPYQETGRVHTFEQAKQIDRNIVEMLWNHRISHHIVEVGPTVVDDILKIIEQASSASS